jgi:serine/threonine protein kinase HipA of HipAB toxin-antitoxin module
MNGLLCGASAESRISMARCSASTRPWLVLNTDAHLKNYSIQLADGTFQPAPLYDVSSLLPYLEVADNRSLHAMCDETKLSMRLADRITPRAEQAYAMLDDVS